MKKIIILSVIFLIILIGVSTPYFFPEKFYNRFPELMDVYSKIIPVDYNFSEKELIRMVKQKPESEFIADPLKPVLFDKDYQVEVFVDGIAWPTKMAFLDNHIIVLEKNTGKIRLVKNGILQENSILDLNVSNFGEQGLLGVATKESFVYLYFTKSDSDGGESLGNHIYQYEWDEKNLINPKLMKKLPGHNFAHNGGALTIDNDGILYAVIGDQIKDHSPIEDYGLLQNMPNGTADDTSVVIKFDSSLKNTTHSNFVDPLESYYAVGIRNSFGLAVDPVTNLLWDTENGSSEFDEINLVEPKFNSGWVPIMGPASKDQIKNLPGIRGFQYSDPEFSWERTVAPTGLTFIQSEKFHSYKNSVFVGDCHLGNLYAFSLNDKRTGFVFQDPNLNDRVLNQIPTDNNERNSESMEEILFGKNFGCITDVQEGPEGNLYVVSITGGAIYRIFPHA